MLLPRLSHYFLGFSVFSILIISLLTVPLSELITYGQSLNPLVLMAVIVCILLLEAKLPIPNSLIVILAFLLFDIELVTIMLVTSVGGNLCLGYWLGLSSEQHLSQDHQLVKLFIRAHKMHCPLAWLNIFFSRLIPGIAQQTAIVAGKLRLPFTKFIVLLGAAQLLLYSGYWFISTLIIAYQSTLLLITSILVLPISAFALYVRIAQWCENQEKLKRNHTKTAEIPPTIFDPTNEILADSLFTFCTSKVKVFIFIISQEQQYLIPIINNYIQTYEFKQQSLFLFEDDEIVKEKVRLSNSIVIIVGEHNLLKIESLFDSVHVINIPTQLIDEIQLTNHLDVVHQQSSLTEHRLTLIHIIYYAITQQSCLFNWLQENIYALNKLHLSNNISLAHQCCQKSITTAKTYQFKQLPPIFTLIDEQLTEADTLAIRIALELYYAHLLGFVPIETVNEVLQLLETAGFTLWSHTLDKEVFLEKHILPQIIVGLQNIPVDEDETNTWCLIKGIGRSMTVDYIHYFIITGALELLEDRFNKKEYKNINSTEEICFA